MKKLLPILLIFFVLCGCSAGSAAASSAAYYISDMKEDYAAEAAGASYSNGFPVVEENSDEKLVYTGSVRLETREYETFSKELSSLIRDYEGIIQSMNENGSSGSRRYLNLTVRIPAQRFDDFLEALRSSSASVSGISTYVDNITRQYSDNELRIEALNVQHERLLQLLTEAQDLSDVILLEERLSDVESELNILQSYKHSMDEDVTYSTITISVSEVVIYSQSSFSQRIAEAFNGSLDNFLSGMEDLLIGFIYFLPFLVILIAVFFLLRKPLKKVLARFHRPKSE
ncbi:MAG: DUF4349 domain-containing protein [Erysipelotrichaceae bacterium]|nr:DUF4349 domain-containing protein [Erysipelotrichaceae bacterium]